MENLLLLLYNKYVKNKIRSEAMQFDLDSILKNTIENKKVNMIIDLLNKNETILVSGKSSSGKTILIAQVIAKKISNNCTFSWIDLQNSETDIDSEFIKISMSAKEADEYIVVVDNIHNSPESIFVIKKYLSEIRKVNKNLKLILIGWSMIDGIIKSAFNDIICVNINPLDLINDLIDKELESSLVEKYKDGILHLSNKDVFVAQHIIEFVNKENVLPTKQQIGNMVFDTLVNNKTLSDDVILVLYYIAILGQFEIQPTYEFLSTISKNGIDELIDFKIIKFSDNKKYCILGHRSLCNQIVLHIEKNIIKSKKLNSIDVVTAYIMKTNKEQIVNVLERLDLQKRNLVSNKNILKTLWNTFINLQEKLYTQLSKDISWNNNLYSSIQSVNSLAFMEFDKNAKTYLDQQRISVQAMCGIDDSGMLIKYKDSTEYIDFTQIINAMKEDDELYPKTLKHDKIDIERFYQTYTIGMLLGFETNFPNNRVIIDKYINLIKNMQDKDGSFYPSRVPWVTARTIISLTRAGLNYNNSEIVKNGCNWLLSIVKNGEWKSGTGYWNTNINVTLLCLEALVKAGFTIENPKIQESLAYIKKEKNKIFINKKEFDAVMYIYNMIKLNYQLSDISDDLETVCKWLLEEDILSEVNLLANESNDESQKAATIINYLIEIIYEILKREMPSLLISLQYEKNQEEKNNYIAIHGSFGNPYCNWFEWLYNIVTEHGQEIIIPQFPTGNKQNYRNWSRILKEYADMGIIDENTIILGHSIAPIFICNFLIENKIRVKRLIFVCGFNNVFNIAPEYDMVNSDMYTEDLSRIHEFCDDIVCLYSDNDPYVPYEKEKEFADIVSDRREVIKGGGHLNAETGYTKFNELLKYL